MVIQFKYGYFGTCRLKMQQLLYELKVYHLDLFYHSNQILNETKIVCIVFEILFICLLKK